MELTSYMDLNQIHSIYFLFKSSFENSGDVYYHRLG